MGNVINTRIKVKYDTLSAWNSSTFVPLQGEVCVAVIPNQNNTYAVGEPDISSGGSGLSPYAVGVKVGDGSRRFTALPWIQAIAGDVYSWAKLPTGGQVPITYNNTTSTIQQAISGLEQSIGGIVSANLTPEALSSALEQLSEQLSGGTAEEKFSSNETVTEDNVTTRLYPTKLIRKVVQTGLDVTVEGDNFAIADLPFQFQTAPTAQNKAATISDIESRLTNITNSLSTAMHFKGEVAGNELPDPTATTTFNTYEAGDVVLFNDAEYVYDKKNTKEASSWILLGDESSYILKGTIGASDLSSSFLAELQDYENVIEQISVNDTPVTVQNKRVNITVPTGDLAFKDSISSSDLENELLDKINRGIEVYNGSGYDTLTPNVTTNNYRLSKIANSGSIYDVTESYGLYLVFDCGSATSLINNPS